MEDPDLYPFAILSKEDPPVFAVLRRLLLRSLCLFLLGWLLACLYMLSF